MYKPVMRRSALQAVAPIAMVVFAGMAAGQQCEWVPLGAGVTRGTTGIAADVNAIIEAEGDLWLGGTFTHAGGAPADRVARWDGANWSPLGDGIPGTVYALAEFDENIYAGGSVFSGPGHLAMWDGNSWSQVDGGVDSTVWTLGTFGGGLVATGGFTMAGSTPANRVALWDGQAFSAFGDGITGAGVGVLAQATFEGALHVGGRFFDIPGMIARWDGQDWSPLGSGLDLNVHELAVFNGELYAGGAFSEAGGVQVSRIARWDGQNWADVAGGVSGPGSHDVRAMTVHNDGTGPALFVGGRFTTAGGVSANRVARWDGTTWTPLGEGTNNQVQSLLSFDGDLYVGGQFTSAGGAPANHIARWVCQPPPCYANCDGSATPPILNVDDFTCFINEFAAAQSFPPTQQVEHYANCDSSTTQPVLNVDDFTCFINAFAQGCP